MNPPPSATFQPDDFRIRRLKCDVDALIGIGVTVALLLLTAATLAFLPETAWTRLVERAEVAWVAGVALLPMLVALHGRFGVRRDAARAMGETAAALAPEVAHSQAIWERPEDAPTSVGAHPILTREDGYTIIGLVVAGVLLIGLLVILLGPAA